MFTLLVTGLTCLMASMVSGEAEAEADPHFFYNPYPSYPYYYPTSYYPYPSYPYYYPTSHYTYPTRFVKTSAAAATPVKKCHEDHRLACSRDRFGHILMSGGSMMEKRSTNF